MEHNAHLLGEFALIARYLAPLASGFPGAFRLLDDAAVIAPPPGHELVAKTDPLVGGVHFLNDDPPDLIARKALRVIFRPGREGRRPTRLHARHHAAHDGHRGVNCRLRRGPR